MSDEHMAWRLSVYGADQSSNAFAQVAQRLGQLDQASRQQSSRFAGLASTSSALGSALSRLNPAVGTLASAFGSAGGAVSGLTAAIGGVGGFVGGGLVAAVALSIQYFTNQRQELARVRAEMIKNEAEATDYAKVLAKIKATADVNARNTRLWFDAASVDEYRAAIQQTSAWMGVLGRQAQEMLAEIGYGEATPEQERRLQAINTKIEGYKSRIDQLRNKLEKAIGREDRVEADRAWKERNAAALEAVNRGESSLAPMGKAGGGKTDLEVLHEYQDQYLKDAVEHNARIAANEEALRERLRKEREAEATDQAGMLGQMTLHDEDYYKAREARLDAFSAKVDEAAESESDARKRAADLATDYAQAGISNMLSSLAKGEKMQIGAIMEGFGDQMVAEGVRRLWQAAGMAFLPWEAPFAAPLAGIGAAEIAAGMGMGAAGKALTSTPGGGSGAPAEPLTRSGVREQTGQPQQVIVNVHTLRPDEESGLAIARSLGSLKNARGRNTVSSASGGML